VPPARGPIHAFWLLRVALLGLAGCLSVRLPAFAAADDAMEEIALHQAHRLLRQLDRFLDHHPLMENDLRLEPKVMTDRQYLGGHPDLQAFLAANPDIVRTLQLEPRHFLHRALLREASVPLKYSEVAQLDPFFETHPAIEREIVQNPAHIRDREYLRLHPALADYLVQRPLLNRVFQPEPTDKL
jgi:hypothetical protein